MLALIVSGRRQVKIMDIYLQPLIDEFKQLWEGIHAYDVSRLIPKEKTFMLYGICAYNTHDYPTLRVVRKTGPRSNKIKQMWKKNTEDTQYKRDTDLRGSPSVGYVHQRNCQVLPLLLSNK
jgi:hypothetical protein